MSFLDFSFDHIIVFFRSSIGLILFIPVYALWVSLLLPGTWVSMFAGLLYGTWLGSLIVFFAAFLGAQIVFLFGRRLFRDWMRRRLNGLPKLQLLQKAVTRQGLTLVILTRLSPLFPFSALNLAYSLSDISFRDYSIGLIGIIPGTIFFCGLGELAGQLSNFSSIIDETNSRFSLILKIVSIISTFLIIFLGGKIGLDVFKKSEDQT